MTDQLIETNLDLQNANRIINVPDAVLDSQAPNFGQVKAYADQANRLSANKEPVRLASAAALPAVVASGKTLTAALPGALSIDGTPAQAGDRVLIKNQADAAQNGIFVVTNAGGAAATFVLTRANDADDVGELPAGSSVVSSEGATNADKLWELVTDGTITPGTTPQSWAQISGRTYSAGQGIDPAQLDSGVIAVQNGQTAGGVTTGVVRGYSRLVGDGAATTFRVTHNLNTRNIDVTAMVEATGQGVTPGWQVFDANSVDVSFNPAPATDSRRVTIEGV